MIFSASFLASQIACSGEPKEYTVETVEEMDGLKYSTTEITSAADGLVSVMVPFDISDSSVLFTLTSNSHLSLELVYDENGDLVLDAMDWYGMDQSLTDAVYADARDVVFNWPIREGDAELSQGNWEFVFSTLSALGEYQGERNATVHTQIKADDDFSQGAIAVTVALTPDTAADADVVSAVEASVECWKSMWSDIGLTLDISYDSANMGTILPYPDASPALETIASQGTERDILMIVGENIANEEGLFGIAGSVPGTLLATERAAVMISWLENAGTDGIFSADELDMMCETMAHETGHYLGLYHPVEMDYLDWDALEDTIRCTDEWECEAELSENLMFPYPICSFDSCVNQRELSSDQQAVIQRYTGTL